MIAQFEAQGWDYSDKLDPLWDESRFYMDAWQMLRTDAPVAYGFAPVPWSAIYSYATAHDELDDLDNLIRLVWALDNRMGAIEAEKRSIEEARRGNENHPDSPGSFGHPQGSAGDTRSARGY